jgi:hypothetical protein
MARLRRCDIAFLKSDVLQMGLAAQPGNRRICLLDTLELD